jgi:pimeloyl-ACP methyl ester carboxylesterase
MSVVLLESAVVHYEALGRGRPVLMLHSWVGSWRYWISAMQTLSSTYRVYAIDLWGFGDSTKLPDKGHFENQVALIDRFLDQMGIGRIALVGHGLGAAVGLEFARRNADFVDRVMAVGYPVRSGALDLRLSQASVTEVAQWLLGDNTGVEAVISETPKVNAKIVQQCLAELPSTPDWNSLPTCLLVNGGNDPLASPPMAGADQVLPENCHEFYLDQAGHFSMLEDDLRFNRLLMEFLALGSGESPRSLQLKEEWKRRVR